MSTTPNTAANGGQILTDERIDSAWVAVNNGWGIMPRELVRKYARAIESDLRAALVAPASPTVDRNAVASIRDSCDYQDFHEDLLRLSEPGLSRKQAKVIRSGIVNTIDARVRAFAFPVAQPAAQGAMPDLNNLTRYRCSSPGVMVTAPSGNYFLTSDVQEFLRAAPATVKTAEGL